MDGSILRGQLVGPDPDRSPVEVERAIAALLADPAVAVVHGRALGSGCFTFEARRAA